jgi:serine/threonine protein kinase
MTMGFSPPEQYGAARTDARTDIYSLGATLYTSLTGLTPEDSLAQTMDQVELTPVRERNPKISKRVSEAVEKALKVHPNDRFQLAVEFKNELLKAQSGRFNINFSLDQVGSVTDQKRGGKAPSFGVITKEITKKKEKESAETPRKTKKSKEPRKRIDRGGCLGLIGLLSLILILGLAVFSLINPTLAKNLFNILF